MAKNRHFKTMALVTLLGLSTHIQIQAASLVTAYQDALKYDSELAASRASLMAEKQGESLAKAGLLPQINLTGSAQHLDNSSDFGDDGYKTTGFKLSLSQPVFRAQAWFDYQTSLENTQIAQTRFSIQQQQLILDLATAYFNVLKAQESLTTTQAAEAAFKRQWQQAKERFDVGLITITEVHEAKANYDATKTARIQAQSSLDIANATLTQLSGVDYDSILDLKASFPIIQPTPANVSAWVAQATRDNLSVRISQLTTRAQQLQLKTKQAGHYPTLDLVASYNDTEFHGLAPADDNQASTVLALQLNMPLYQGGGTQAAIHQARYQLQEAELNLETTRRKVKLNTTTLYRTILTDIETVSSQKQNIVSRESALEATKSGYSVGTRNIVEVLDAERNYFTALRDYAVARYDYVIDTLRLKQAAGSLSPQDIIDIDKWLAKRIAMRPRTGKIRQ